MVSQAGRRPHPDGEQERHLCNGSVVSGSSGLFTGDALKAELRAGDFVVVPEKAYSGTSKWKTSLQVAQLVSAAGIAIQVARGF